MYVLICVGGEVDFVCEIETVKEVIEYYCV